ncbi:poly polymerase catalytic domain-containing protein [Fusarium oxysporum f. sp. albedinis]|nr:poly polymerase catalytic domain-containing protein [Fusarium oxysporum f. sp. albedinis]
MAGKAKLPFRGCTIAITGIFVSQDGKYKRDILKNLIPKKADYLVSTEASYKSRTGKILTAEDNKVSIMKLGWLIDHPSNRKVWLTDAYLWENNIQKSSESTDESETDSIREKSPEKTKKGVRVKDGVKINSDLTNTSDVTAKPGTKRNNKPIKRKDVVIPLDEHCTLGTYKVYIDPKTGLIYDASLNQTVSSTNKNKFYNIQVLKDPESSDCKTWTRWGRVGEVGAYAILGNGTSGLAWNNRKDSAKPGKYVFLERRYSPHSDYKGEKSGKKAVKKVAGEQEHEVSPPECSLEKPVKELMELIFNQQCFSNTISALKYDANKLPIGKLSKRTITSGFKQLKDLAALIDDPTLASSKWNMGIAEATEHLSNTYYSFIPHVFGRKQPPIIRDENLLKKEIELLQSLPDMQVAADLMKIDRKTRDSIHPLNRQFQGLGLAEMTRLDDKSSEFGYLMKYLNNSGGAAHKMTYTIKDIFRIERLGERKRFDKSEFSKIPSNRRLLWHGSRSTNFAGILSQGLRIGPPEAPVSGYMFGKGIYLADCSSKSAGYCYSTNTGGEALLVLCEAALGAMQTLIEADYNAGIKAKKNGMHSTWGQGKIGPRRWVDAGIVHPSLKGVEMPNPIAKLSETGVKNTKLHYNEYICYDVAQVRLRYLLYVMLFILRSSAG